MDEIELDPAVTFKPASEKNIPNLNTINNHDRKANENLNEEEIKEVEDKFEEKETQNSTTTSLNWHKQINFKSSNLDYDNKAFELEDIQIDSKANVFVRQERPGSMMSIKTSASTISRTSINCVNGRVRCPNIRLQRFYSYRSDVGFAKVSQDLKPLILPEKDGTFIGNWLLIEISNWDFHREKIALLTEKTLMIINYNFIKSRIENYNRISLSDLKRISYGTLKYPKKSFMGEYDYGAVKLCWAEENLSFIEKWNPFSEKIPFLILTSHHILYNEKEKETTIYNCDDFINSLEFALSKLPKRNNIEMKQEDIEIENYANIMSVLYNQNWLGFQLDRNGISF